MEYELKSSGAEIAPVGNVVKVIMNILEVISPGLDDARDPFWNNSVKALLKNSLTAQLIAKGSASLFDVYRIASSASNSKQDFFSKEWQQKTYCGQTMRALNDIKKTGQTAYSKQDINMCLYYFSDLWGEMDKKLRTNITATLSSMIDPFMTGRLHEMLCTGTNVYP